MAAEHPQVLGTTELDLNHPATKTDVIPLEWHMRQLRDSQGTLPIYHSADT